MGKKWKKTSFLTNEEKDYIKQLGLEYHESRVGKDLTIDDVSDYVGKGAHYIEEFEKGNKDIHIDMLERLYKALGIEITIEFKEVDKHA